MQKGGIGMDILNKRKKGFSLVEVLCAMVILSLILLTAVMLLQMGARSNVEAVREYDIQSGMRLTMETVTNKVRYSTAVFIIPESGFREDNLEEGWDYVGVLPNDAGLNEIVEFQYVEDAGYHRKMVLLAVQEGFDYDLEFTKQEESYENQLINYICTVYQNGSEYWTIASEAAAMNSLQVVNWGTNADKGRAIAYQGRDRESKKVTGRVAMVLDVSGSMRYSFAGENNNSLERHYAMVESAKQLLDKLAEYDNIEVTIIPYSTTGNLPEALQEYYESEEYIFLSAQSDNGKLHNIVDELSPRGGTNIGDGLRRAYQAFLWNDAESESRNTADYVILVSDGDMTIASMKELRPYAPGTENRITLDEVINRDFFTNTGSVPNTNTGLLYGGSYRFFDVATGEVNRSVASRRYDAAYEGGDLTGYQKLSGCIYGINSTVNRSVDVYSKGYVYYMGGELTSYGITPYFVAVSASVSDAGIEIVKDAMSIDNASVYNPLNQQALLDAFESIGKAIVTDLWFISGPAW